MPKSPSNEKTFYNLSLALTKGNGLHDANKAKLESFLMY